MKSLFFLVKTAGFHIFPIVSFGFPMVFKPPMGLPLSLRLQCEDPHQPRALYDELEDARVKRYCGRKKSCTLWYWDSYETL